MSWGKSGYAPELSPDLKAKQYPPDNKIPEEGSRSSSRARPKKLFPLLLRLLVSLLPMAGVQHMTVSEAEAGQKLLSFLRRRLGKDLPQSVLMKIIRTGQVRVDGGRKKPFDRVEAGQTVRVPPLRLEETPPPAEKAGTQLDIVHEDEALLILHKINGLPVHGGSGHEDSVVHRLQQMYYESSFMPTPVHRLDKDTSGVLLIAKSYAALQELSLAFKEHRILKRYLAWVRGFPPEERFSMRDELEKTGAAGREAVTTGSGKEALSHVQLLRSRAEDSLLQVDIATGRTHQIRVQLASRGLPILGDRKYGPTVPKLPMLLHAWQLTLPDGRIFRTDPHWPPPYSIRP
jgi:23S rRNA pseudouridine955/2504/2580 synthase